MRSKHSHHFPFRTCLIRNYAGSSDPYKISGDFHVIIKQQQQSAIILNSLTGNNINYNDNILSALSVYLPTTTTGNYYPKTTKDSTQGPDFVKIKVPRVLVERRRLSAGKRAGDCGRSRRKAPQ